ncbi:type VI secretion system-associated FHA domain protein TagH [Methylotuvimicrobium sp. KM2]|uniref:type VI secretion system-associated FHA domain protein TagH n=1 Tax=Methylotuvimicrobium sp. KM2 TaxID=3133976 RepID=UPI003101415F
MALSLKITTYKGKPLSEPKLVAFPNDEGTIGRSDDNTLVLPDPDKFVSRHHASIKYENNTYYLTDSSLAGVFIDNEANPLHNDSIPLHNGILLKVGEYEIEAIITEDTSRDDFPFPDIFADSPSKSTEPEELFSTPVDTEANRLMGDSSSPFPRHEELIDAKENETPEFESHLQDHASPLFDSFIAPQVEAAPKPFEEIPENLSFEDLFADSDTPSGDRQIEDDSRAASMDLLNESFAPKSPLVEPDESASEPVSPPVAIPDSPQASNLNSILADPSGSSPETPQAQPVQSISDNGLFDAFLHGAGLDQNECATKNQLEAMQRIGRMFRQLVAGTVSVLRSRAEFKSLFRVNVTVIRAVDNNPLKFAVSTNDVLKQLIQNKEGGFLESVESIEQGFNDIMNHQLAMQAGIQASLADLLKRFDPKTIEKQFEQGIVLQKKAKCWDSYQDTYRIESEEAVENFFGDAFVEAYEEQMKALTAARNKKEKFGL